MVDSEYSLEAFKNPEQGARSLRGISIFENFTDTELSELYALGQIRVYQAKSNVVIEGEMTRGLFVLLKGTVSVYKTDTVADTLIRLAFLEQGAVFGELSLFDKAPRSATIIAEGTIAAFNLGIDAFDRYLTEKGDNLKTRFYKKCAEDMADRFRRQNSDYLMSQQLLWKHALRRGDQVQEGANDEA